MRIIAGHFKGRRLVEPGKFALRPTSDSLRETLFNVLGSSVNGAVVLDGFAGTGALGLEALSRGARRATFVESDRRAITLIEENIRRCGVENACAIVKRDFLARSPERQHAGPNDAGMFDLILLDPPYDVDDLEAVVREGASMLSRTGRLVLEHSRRRASPMTVTPLQRVRLLTAGDSALSFYEH